MLLAVTAVAVGLGWYSRSDRFQNSPQVYAFQLAAADGRPLRGAVAFVREHRLFSHSRRLQLVVFIDLEPHQRDSVSAPANLQIRRLGEYRVNYDWWSQPHLFIPGVHENEQAALPLRLDRGDFGSGAVHEIAGTPVPYSDRWQTIVGRSSTLGIQTKPLTLTWDELLDFVNDQNIDRWTFEAAHRWKYGRN
jgi:hypothetical protein